MTISDHHRATMTVEDMVLAYRCWEAGEEYTEQTKYRSSPTSRHPIIDHIDAQLRAKDAARALYTERDSHARLMEGLAKRKAEALARIEEARIGLDHHDFGREDPRVVLKRGTEAADNYRKQTDEEALAVLAPEAWHPQPQEATFYSDLDYKVYEAYTAKQIKDMTIEDYMARRNNLLADASDGRIDGRVNS